MILVKEMLEELHNLKELGLISKWVIQNGEIAYIGKIDEFVHYDVIKAEEWENILSTINKKMEWWLS